MCFVTYYSVNSVFFGVNRIKFHKVIFRSVINHRFN